MDKRYVLLTAMMAVVLAAYVAYGLSYIHVVSRPAVVVKHIKGAAYSLNWAGYVVSGQAGAVTSVAGSFVVPSLTCTKQTTYVALWAGLDGYNDNTVEQAGILGECSGGKPIYEAWYEFYPSPSVPISGLTVQPGDRVYVNVTYLGNGQFAITMVIYETNGKVESYSVTGTEPSAQLSSAECILERPTVNGQLTALANFGTAYFGQDYTSIGGTCYARVNGVVAPFGSLSAIQLVMVSSSGKILAQPSSLTGDGSSFTVTFVNSR
ncbi:MAG: G1 family glutamic endopeptidase [Thermoproteus sp.]